MSQDYSEEDDFDGFSDHEEAQVYLNDDVSEGQTHLYDEEASEGASDSDDESKEHDGFLDDEASEAESDLESDQFYEQSTTLYPDTLHSFMRLPIELREMIWKQFCPDLSNNPRVFELNFDGKWPIFAPQIESQTEPLRRVLAIHQESRKIGHKFAPHLIQLPHDNGVAPCHMERDIVLVDWKFDHRYCPGEDELMMLAEVAPGLQNLAVQAGVTLFDGGPDLDRLYSLRNVFVAQDADMIPTIGLTWCLSDNVHSYHVVHAEDVGNGLTQDLDMHFYWPDPEKHGESGERRFSSRSFGSLQFDEEGYAVNDKGERIENNSSRHSSTSNWGYEIARLREWLDPLHAMHQTSAQQSRSGSSEPEIAQGPDSGPAGHEEDGPETDEQSSLPQPQRISVWPLARFEFADGVSRLEAMKAWSKPWEEWESEGVSDDFEEDWDDDDDPDSLDGFIDFGEAAFSEIDDDDEQSSSVVLDNSSQPQIVDVDSADEDESATEQGSSSRGPHENEVVIDLVNSSGGEENQDGEEEEDGEDAVTESRGPGRWGLGRSGRRIRCRRMGLVLDDEDDNDDDDDDDIPKPSRSGNRRVAIPSSDSEDDTDEDTAKTNTSRPTGEDDEEPSSEEEEEEEDEEDSEEDMPPPPKMSLAKKLRLEAAQARAALAADDSDDEDQDGGASDDDEEALDDEEMGMGLEDEDEEDNDEEGW